MREIRRQADRLAVGTDLIGTVRLRLLDSDTAGIEVSSLGRN